MTSFPLSFFVGCGGFVVLLTDQKLKKWFRSMKHVRSKFQNWKAVGSIGFSWEAVCIKVVRSWEVSIKNISLRWLNTVLAVCEYMSFAKL